MTGQDDWLSHKSLMIIKGIGATPGDTYSAENQAQVVNLMSGIISLEDWSPNIPAIKGGGVWASSPIADGRQLLAAPVGNVVEKMSIRITDTSYLGIMTQMTALNQMVQDCRDYWQSDYQIDPVYLLWAVSCGGSVALPQYALISNIDLAPEYEQSPSPSIRVSISIEREPAWRGIPPGANPRIWTYYVDPSKPQFNVNAATLMGLSASAKDLINEVIRNKFEWSPTTYGLQTTFISKNYIDITAAQVPGDAPALVEFAMLNNGAPIASVFVGRTSKKLSGTDHLGIARACALNLNAGDGNTASVVVKTAGISTTGILSNGSSVTFYYGERNATGIDANFITAVGWGGATGANGIKLDRQFYRGTYAIFVRATNNSAAPTLADMRMRVFIEEFEDAANQYVSSITLPEVQVPLIVGGAGETFSYMGTVTLPLANRAVVSPLGYGVQLQEANSNLRISLQLKYDVATANRIFRVEDLMLFPVDEGMAQLAANTNSSGAVGTVLFDNTGYLSRGELKQSCVFYNTNSNSGGSSQEVRGQDITLKPGVDQRLYFLITEYSNPPNSDSRPWDQMTVGLNIVPRWFGIRDT